MERLRDKRDVIYPCVKSEANKLLSELEVLFRRSVQCLILCNDINNVTVMTGVGKSRCCKLLVCAIISVFLVHISFPIFLSEIFFVFFQIV
jgi:hypothetical protein